ncbi:MAG TPA: STAS-like domain-containing protein [bacterium]|nr:STAS-like domain-containing protein [bacterium]HPS29211.1 STAS-like domain-containing protein [bacterium]
MKEITIKIFNTVGSSSCVAADDGQKVFDLIKEGLRKGQKILLSFQNVEFITTAFLNTAIGQLYRDFDENTIKNSLRVEHLSNDDMVRFKRVTDTAKLYYKNPEKLENSIKEVLGE